MNDEYDSAQRNADAVEFANSRFGQHYLKRLAEVRDDHFTKARAYQKEGRNELVADRIARADEIDGEIIYFQLAQEQVKRTMAQRLKDTFVPRGEA